MLHTLVSDYQAIISAFIKHNNFGEQPTELYEPIRYILNLGGKRLRPVLTLLAHHLYKDLDHASVAVGSGIEVFHNFSLLHDDIMDNAPVRRGQPTVHEKWNANVAILSGDVMLVRAYQMIMQVPDDNLRWLLHRFSETAAQVCEGQQWDMNFESLPTVTVEQYLDMIKLKTAVLLGFSLEAGGITAYASEHDRYILNQIGTLAGIGFQLMDDLLDVYGEADKFGKRVGGDIVSNKKTFLLIDAIEEAKNTPLEDELNYWLSVTDKDDEKVQTITAIYNTLGVKDKTEQLIAKYFTDALNAIHQLEGAREDRKQHLSNYLKQLMSRDS